MTEHTCTIAVDIGTTNLKAVAFRDRDGREIAQAHAAVALWTDETGAAEQDALAVYEAATELLARLVGQVRASGYDVARAGLSAAMHSLLAVGADGRPLSRALIWMDTRARAEADALWSSAEGKASYARTGAPIHPMTPIAKLIWLGRHRPDLVRQAARFVSLKEWVWHGWFGEWQVDASIAGATGLYGLRNRDWDGGALALAGITADRLSRVVPTTFIGRGLREPRLLAAGLAPETPFVIGASDGVLANLGVGAIGRERLVLTVGTSLATRVGSSELVTDPDTRSFCYVLAEDRFIVGGPSNSGGILLDWLANKVLAAPDPDGAALGELIAAAESVETGTLLCLPYVAGERAPLWDAAARAAFIGLDINHGRPHLMRAAVEGMILNARWIVAGLLERIGRPEEIVATGNPFRQAWIRQLTADVFGIPVRHRSDTDASLLGAALLARIATGATDWAEVLGVAPGSEEIVAEPLDAARYEAKYERFRRLAVAVANPGASPGPAGSEHPDQDAEAALLHL